MRYVDGVGTTEIEDEGRGVAVVVVSGVEGRSVVAAAVVAVVAVVVTEVVVVVERRGEEREIAVAE